MKRLVVLSVLLFRVLLSDAAVTATFTADGSGTHPNTLSFDRKKSVLTVDLSSVPKDATIFRAELYLNGRERFVQPPAGPTTVYPLNHPNKKLSFAAPRFVSLDALNIVRENAGGKLELKLQTTLRGVKRLEVSYMEGQPPRPGMPAVTGLKVTHRAGQSLIVFTEPKLKPFPGQKDFSKFKAGEDVKQKDFPKFKTGEDVKQKDFPKFKTGADVLVFKKALLKEHPGLRFRVWRGPERITPKTITTARLVGECGLMTCWNDTYWQDNTGKKPPIRYRVTDGGEPVRWGTGIYAHNPARPGKAFYAVTVAVDGVEDFGTLCDENTTSAPIEETTGMGEPILQWVEHIPAGRSWSYRKGPLTRIIYTRWESWGPPGNDKPHSSTPSKPIDYLVAMGDDSLTAQDKLVREWFHKAWRVEPAPVGLHLHCWGGSLNGGYGWWYNAHRGAVLIASNQIPYDWWTGYHEANGTCKTYGDGHVWPFTMNRLLGFLDWATTQWKDAPASVRKDWRKLDLSRVFTAGSSMGGSGAPMYSVRFGDRIAWSLGWVGVHIPAESPHFVSSYRQSYGPEKFANTMQDGVTNSWDYFSDAWWLRHHPKAETGFIIASNGKNDSGIGWLQAVHFIQALQDTRRPHMFNWAMQGHGTRTLVGSNFDLDVRTDKSLPAFTHCSLDDDYGTGTNLSRQQIEAKTARQKAEVEAGKRKNISVDGIDGDSSGQVNGYLWWRDDDIVDTPCKWAMTVLLKSGAPESECRVDLTPRRIQKFAVSRGKQFTYTVTDLKTKKVIDRGLVSGDELCLVTLKQIRLKKGANRVKIVPKLRGRAKM